MRFSVASLLLFVSSHAQAENRLLRSTNAVDTSHHAIENDVTKCINIKDETSCIHSTDDDGSSCVWCKCAAVPSECLSMKQSESLPAGVFQCSSTATVEQHGIEPFPVGGMDVTADIPYSPRSYILNDDEVDPSLCDPDSKSFSGYVDITGSKYDADGEDKHLFYWFFEKRSSVEGAKTDDTPLILWLTGGPGCSSTLALLSENGPCKVAPDGLSTEINPFSWTETAHVLWLDQPAGVGFSYGKETDFNEEMISEDAYYFLQGFYKEHPDYSENPLFVVGESYGGHYAPAISHKVWLKNKNRVEDDDDLIHINLAGLAIGNGLTDPVEQYKWYPEMAFNNSHGIKTVSETVYKGMKSAVSKCTGLIKECNKGNSVINRLACQSAFIFCNSAETTPYQMTGLNPYDIRLECGPNPLCYDFSNVEHWLNLDSTKTALHVHDQSHWESCNMGINLKFHTDWMKDFSPYVADLLNDNIPALIYAGDVDFICNYMGNRAWTLNLEWSSGDEFRNADDHEWGEGEGAPFGLARSANGFTFLQVYDAGHMVPSDQPTVALKMIQNFVEGTEF